MKTITLWPSTFVNDIDDEEAEEGIQFTERHIEIFHPMSRGLTMVEVRDCFPSNSEGCDWPLIKVPALDRADYLQAVQIVLSEFQKQSRLHWRAQPCDDDDEGNRKTHWVAVVHRIVSQLKELGWFEVVPDGVEFRKRVG